MYYVEDWEILDHLITLEKATLMLLMVQYLKVGYLIKENVDDE